MTGTLAADQYAFDESEAPEIKGRLKTAPKIRELFWCRLWNDAVKPEFWKQRPVVVVSYKNTLSGPCSVVPLTTKPQDGSHWSIKLPYNYIDPTKDSWVVCNYVMTVSTSRLSTIKGKSVRLQEAEFSPILEKILEWLPKPSAAPK